MICGDKQSAHNCTSFSDEGHIPQLQDNSFTPDISEQRRSFRVKLTFLQATDFLEESLIE